MTRTLGLFARRPECGRVKTRLAESIGPAAACELYTAMLRDTVERSLGHESLRHELRLVLAYTPGTAASAAELREWFPPPIELWPQPEGSLGERLEQFFATWRPQSDEGVVVIGTDSPTLPSELIAEAFSVLRRVEAVLGPAMDGGFYLLGLRPGTPVWSSDAVSPSGGAPLFHGIAWDGPDVLRKMVERLEGAELSLRVLPPWYDVDVLRDLQMLAGHLRALRAAGVPSPCPRTEQVLERLPLPQADSL